MASSLVFLGNHFPTTESRIVDFTERIAGTADALGFAVDQTLAWGAAVTSSGIQAETGATAIRRVLTDMSLAVANGSEDLGNFARVAGVSGEAFRQAFREDASGALQAFVEGLAKLDPQSQILALDSLGLSAQRVGSTLQNLAANSDLVKDALDGSAKAFREGVALQEEFAKRTSTVKSALQLLRNQFTALGIAVFDATEGDLRRFIEGLGDIIDRLAHVDPAIIQTIAKIALIVAVVGPVLVVLGLFISSLGTVFTAIGVLLSPVGLLAVGLIALGGAFAIAFAPQIQSIIQGIGTEIQRVLGLVQELFNSVTNVPSVSIAGPVEGPGQRSRPGQGAGQPAAGPPVRDASTIIGDILNIPPIPQETLDSLDTFKTTVLDVVNTVTAALQSFGEVWQTTVGSNISGTLATLGESGPTVLYALLTAVGIVVKAIGGLLIGLAIRYFFLLYWFGWYL